MCRLFQIARFMGPTWGPPGADRTKVGPMFAPWTLLSGVWSELSCSTQALTTLQWISAYGHPWTFATNDLLIIQLFLWNNSGTRCSRLRRTCPCMRYVYKALANFGIYTARPHFICAVSFYLVSILMMPSTSCGWYLRQIFVTIRFDKRTFSNDWYMCETDRQVFKFKNRW